jgi:hypothetical protein
MRRILLSMLLAVSLVGFARAQEATGDKAEEVKGQILKLKQEQDRAFDSTGTSNNYATDWAERYEADGLVHMTERLRNKTELLDELQNGKRKIITSKHYGHQFHVYGNGEDGTTVIVTYFIDVTLELDGKRTTRHNFAVDTFVHQKGQWWCVVHSAHRLQES